MDEGDYRTTITQLKEVVRLEPDNFEAHLDLDLLRAEGLLRRGRRAYVRAREELQPEDLLLNYNRLRAVRALGKPRDALEALRKAVASDPPKVRGRLQSDPMFDALKGSRSSTSSRTGETQLGWPEPAPEPAPRQRGSGPAGGAIRPLAP